MSKVAAVVVPRALLLAATVLSTFVTVRALRAVLAHRPALVVLWGAPETAVILGSLACLAVASTVALVSQARDWGGGRWEVGRLAPFRALFCAAVLGWLGLLWLGHPAEPIKLEVAAGLALGTFGSSCLVLPRLPRWPVVRLADYVLFNACLFVVLAELGLRWVAAVRPTPLLVTDDTQAESQLAARKVEPGHYRYGFPFNSLGYYDDEPTAKRAGRRLVVVIGDSFCEGIVPHPFNFTTVCEELCPNTDVHNMGVSGIGPIEYEYILWHDALPLDPDLVVVSLYVGNDLGYATVVERAHPTLRRWCHRDNVLVWLLPARWTALRGERRFIRERYEESRLSSFGRDVEELVRRFPWLEDPMLEKPSQSLRGYLPVERQRGLEILSYSDATYERLFAVLDRILEVAGRVPILFVLMPAELQVEDALWTELGFDETNLVRDQPQRVLSGWLEGRGVPYLDVLPVLLDVEPLADGRRHVYQCRDPHFNVRGNRVVGEALAPLVRGH